MPVSKAQRGTGFTAEESAIKVFEDSVAVEGKSGADPTVGEGKGIGTNPDGSLGDTFDVSDEDWEDWDKFVADVEGEGSDEDEDAFGGESEEGSEADDQKDIDDSLEPDEDRGNQEFFVNVKGQ